MRQITSLVPNTKQTKKILFYLGLLVIGASTNIHIPHVPIFGPDFANLWGLDFSNIYIYHECPAALENPYAVSADDCGEPGGRILSNPPLLFHLFCLDTALFHVSSNYSVVTHYHRALSLMRLSPTPMFFKLQTRPSPFLLLALLVRSWLSNPPGLFLGARQ